MGYITLEEWKISNRQPLKTKSNVNILERSDKSANLKLSGKTKDTVMKPKGKTKYVSQNSMPVQWKGKEPRTSESDEK